MNASEFSASIHHECELRIYSQHRLETKVKATPDLGFISYNLNTINGQSVSLDIVEKQGCSYCIITGATGITDSDFNFYVEDFSQIRNLLDLQ